MILLIDGYNVLKNIYQNQITESVRSNFINKLNSYSKNKNHQIVLVFDGGPMGFPTKEKINYVELVYSGYKRTADEIIKNYLSDFKDKDILLISSDRDLQKFANSLNIDFISVKEFYKIFVYQKNSDEKNIKKDSSLYKMTENENPEVDELMRQVGDRVFEKDIDYKIDKNRFVKDSVSKKEKRLHNKIKKL